MKIIFCIMSFFVLFFFGCNASKDKNKTELSYSENNIIEQDIKNQNENIEKINTLNNNVVLEDDINNFTIPETYEEALKLMKKLNIENVVLEILIINGENYTVVEAIETGLTVGTDIETNIYEIPDKSGNILLTIPYKNEIQATILAIIEEPSIKDWGEGMEHWVKIKMEDDTIGWVRGEYTSINRGGIKYRTKKNIWLWENYSSRWI